MRMTRLSAGATLAMALLAFGTARAGIENSGTTAANFLSLGAGARILGMGGATLALGGDVGAAGWNTAAAGWLGETEAVLSHAGLQGGGMQEWGAVSGRVGNMQTRWLLTGLYQGIGAIEGRDATGASTGNFSASSMAIGGAVAQKIGDLMTLGVGAKSVTEKLGSVTGTGVTFDAGVMARLGSFGLGLAAQNIGGHMTYSSLTFPFPTNVGAGIAYTHTETGLRFALDANFPYAYYRDVRAGVEWQWKDVVALRAGYRQELGAGSDPLSGPTFGVGAGRENMWLDYGYLIGNAGQGEHRLGLRMRLGNLGLSDPFSQKSEEPKSASPKSGLPSKPKGIDASPPPSLIGPPAPRNTSNK